MKKTIILLFAFFVQYPSTAQKLRDRLEYKVTYKLTYKLDSTNLQEVNQEYMILSTGDELSVFSSHAKTLTNRFIINGNMGHTKRAAITKFPPVILKGSKKNQIYYTLQFPKTDSRFYYVEDKNLFDWDIKPKTKTIKGYKTQKATTTFAGRDYVAWFTPEIPVPDGPYKFNGLPGLILEIADTKGHYVFDFVGLEKLSPPAPFRINLKHYSKTNKEKLAKLFYNFRRDPFSYDGEVVFSPEVHKQYVEDFTKMLEKENNPIELE